MARVEVAQGDITREDVDAIVNAANSSLRGGGGVDGAIHRAAGPQLAVAGGALAPCAPGDAVTTPAISTGIFGYPPDQAARIAVDTVRSTSTGVELIRLVAFDRATYDLLTATLDS